MATLAAVDLGAQSGRVAVGRFDGERFGVTEVHRFPNVPVETLMKLNAMAKFERKPSVRLSSGLIPKERRWASSRSA